MPEHQSADQQMLAILARLQKVAGDLDKLNPGELDPGELDRIREILTYGPTLVQLAKYEEAKGLFWAHWRGVILGLAGVLSALVLIGSTLRKWGGALWQAIQ